MKTKQLTWACTLLLAIACLSGCISNNKTEQIIQTTPKTEEMKKVIRAEVAIKPEKVDAFIEATKSIIEQSRAEDGNISYTLYQSPVDKTQFIFFEEWKDQAAIDFHFNTEHFKSFGSISEELRSAPTKITIYDVFSEKN